MSSIALDALQKDSELRTQTDKKLSSAWILLPIATIVIEIAIATFTFFSVLSQLNCISSSACTVPASTAYNAFGGFTSVVGVGLVAQIINIYFFYMLIRRRNQHFPRQQRFASDLITVLRGAANKKSTNIDLLLGSMENSLRRSQVEEDEKSAVLWVILMLVPVVNLFALLYIFYFLTGDFYKHERWEDGMLSDIERAMSALGVQFVFHRDDPIPHRSYVLYLLVTIITVGIFGLYWEYTLIADPNKHFAHHAVFEPAIIQAITPLAS